MDFPGGSVVKNPPASANKRHWFDPRVGKIPRSRKWQPAPVFLPGKSHGQRSLAGYSPWGRKELDRTQRMHAHMRMRTHTHTHTHTHTSGWKMDESNPAHTHKWLEDG